MQARHLFIALVVLLSLYGLSQGLDAAQAQPPDVSIPQASETQVGLDLPYLERVGAWPYGNAEAIALDPSRNLSFLGTGGAVLVVDVTQPATPTLVSDAIHTAGFVEDLYYDSNAQLLYIAAGKGGMEIWDLQNPALPQRLSATELYYSGVEIPVLAITVISDWAYVAADWAYLHWVDVSDPSNPVQTGFSGLEMRPEDVYSDGTYLYAAGDATNSFDPVDVAIYSIGVSGTPNLINGRELGLCGSVYASGTYVYVGCGDWFILDGAQPNMPLEAQVAIDPTDTFVSGTLAYVTDNFDGLYVFDVSLPSSPTQLDLYDSPGSAAALAGLGNYVYLADGYAGLRVLDVLSPSDVSEVGFYETFGRTVATVVQGQYAYLAEGYDGLAIVDVSNPTTPTLASHHDTPEITYDVDAQGDYAYVADLYGGLRVVDVSNPVSPTETGVYDAYDVYRVSVEGDYAYVVESVVNQPYWLHVIDVSDPFSPTEMGAIEMPGMIWEVYAQDGYVYLAADDDGLRVVDVSSPTNPTEVAVYPIPDAIDVTARGDLAYVAAADWDGGLLILDISDPTNPTLVSLTNPSGWFHPFYVAVSGPYAYTGEPAASETVRLFDISDPANPIELEDFSSPGEMVGLSAAGPYMFISDGKAGLQIYENLLPLYQASLGPDSHIDASPGSSVTHHFVLENLGETDRYSLTVTGNDWPTTLLTTSPITVPALSTATLSVQVEVPASFPSAILDSDLFSLTAASAGDPGLVLTSTGTTRAAVEPAVQLSPASQTLTGQPGQTITHSFRLTNAGDYTDSFGLALSGHAWQTWAPTSTAPLAPDSATQIDVAVQIPTDPGSLSLLSDTFDLSATSATDPAMSAQASGTTLADVTAGVQLSPDQTGSAEAGQEISYTFRLTNTGDYSDSFSLSLSHTWSAALDRQTITDLPPQASTELTLTVQVPADVADGAQHTTTLTATSVWDIQVSATTHAYTSGWADYTIYLPIVLRNSG